MRLVTFDPFRTLGMPGASYVKPDLYPQHLEVIRSADWLLFPEYRQVNSLVYAHRKRVFPSVSSYRDYCRGPTGAGRQSLYAQAYLPVDRDLRIVVIGREVVASYWRVQAEGAFLNNLAAGGTLESTMPGSTWRCSATVPTCSSSTDCSATAACRSRACARAT
ncbi:MAG: hypothetical protein RIC56_12845 [Pseudomonadales bacterium]